MKLQLLTFPDCPNAVPAREALREAMDQEHVTDRVEEIDVSRDDAPSWAKRWGSPTILVDGRDVGGESPNGAVSCRLYKTGAPSTEQIRERIRAARSEMVERKRWRLPVMGAVLAATAASACCLGPAVLAIVGVSSVGVASTLALYLPYLFALTASALTAGFYFAYRPARVVDDCECATPKSRLWTRVGLWISTLLVIGIAGYPLMFDANASVHTRIRGVAEVKLHVSGMDCAACTKVLAKALSRVQGVATADIDYEHQLAIVTHDGKRDIAMDLIDAVHNVGYEATVLK